MGNHCFSKLQIRIWLRCWYHLLWVAGFKRIGNDSTLIRSKLKTSPGKNCYQQLLQHANTMSWLTEPSKKMLRKTRDKVITQWVWSTDGPHRSAALGLPTHQRELGPDQKKKKNKKQTTAVFNKIILIWKMTFLKTLSEAVLPKSKLSWAPVALRHLTCSRMESCKQDSLQVT